MRTNVKEKTMKATAVFMVVLGGLLMLTNCASKKNEGRPAGLYKDAEARAIAFESYNKAMELWPVEYAEDWVETEYGITHIIVSGPQGAKPLFLLPGTSADATIWCANVGALAEQYRVYTLDLPTFGGKSEPSDKTVNDTEDYTAWFIEIMNNYGYNEVAVAGLSYGSWLSLALAREIPEAIAAVIMLDPAGTFSKMDGGIAWRGMWTYVVFPNRAKYAKFFHWLGGGYTDPQVEIVFEHMLDVAEYGSVSLFDVPRPMIYSSEELTMVTMPVLVMAGGKPILYKNPEKFAAAAAEALPHAKIEIIPCAGHMLNAEKATEVNGRMTRFLSENYL
jgi:pimeloyl-ACP methyl ester carboxylesterase